MSNDERTAKGYNDKKEFICVCCGKTVLLTKFASAKTAKCEECKSSGAQPNQDILSNIQSTKSKSNKPVVMAGSTKVCKCTQCGEDTTVSKFMSESKVICNSCKGMTDDNISGELPHIKVDITKLDKSTLPNIEDYYVLPSVINNPRLRDVTCPACGKESMKILQINDSSADRGLVLAYQCTGCFTLVNISEQCRYICEPRKPGHMFNYRGEEIKSLLPAIRDTQLRNALEYLIKLAQDNNIEISGIDIPPYRKCDKQIPIGFDDCGQSHNLINTIDHAILVRGEDNDKM